MEPPTTNERPSDVGARRDVGVRRDVAVLGASAGGVEALTSVVRGLSADVPLSLVVVLHMPSAADSRLAEILSRAGPVPAAPAEHGSPLEPGRIVVAPRDRHLVLSGDRTFLVDGPRENGFRPGIDPLFRSAARSLGPRAIGVILSGTMDDGAAGLAAIQSFGGATIVQDPEDALAAGMPQSAIDTITPDHVAPATSIGRLLDKLARNERPPQRRQTGRGRDTKGRPRPAPRDLTLVADPMELLPYGVDLACPECGGALQEVVVGPMSRFRCRTGHVYSPRSLLDIKGSELEGALWAAVRALEEEATVAGRLAARSKDMGADSAARRFETRQGDAAERADIVRQAIHSIGGLSRDVDDAADSPTSSERGTVEAAG
jgi:two-component system, chemotaxis family, protein-glutamate methylesterase/glutaminase